MFAVLQWEGVHKLRVRAWWKIRRDALKSLLSCSSWQLQGGARSWCKESQLLSLKLSLAALMVPRITSSRKRSSRGRRPFAFTTKLTEMSTSSGVWGKYYKKHTKQKKWKNKKVFFYLLSPKSTCVDLGLPGIICPLPTLLSLHLREILAPPLRGGAQERAMWQGCCRREGVAVVVVVLCVAVHLKKKK